MAGRPCALRDLDDRLGQRVRFPTKQGVTIYPERRQRPEIDVAAALAVRQSHPPHEHRLEP